jgi:hypothetical protein
MAFDSLPYVDLLLNDLGLPCHRKGGWGWRELFVPYNQSDYRGLVTEWIENIQDPKEHSATPNGPQGTAETKKVL